MPGFKKKLIFLFLLLVPVITEASVIIKPSVQFKLREYNTFLKFENEINLSKIVVEEDIVYFDDCWFKLKGGNITFKEFLENYNLTFSLEGLPASTSEVEIYTPFKPLRVFVNGIEQEEGTMWSYNPTNNTVKITYTF